MIPKELTTSAILLSAYNCSYLIKSLNSDCTNSKITIQAIPNTKLLDTKLRRKEWRKLSEQHMLQKDIVTARDLHESALKRRNAIPRILTISSLCTRELSFWRHGSSWPYHITGFPTIQTLCWQHNSNPE